MNLTKLANKQFFKSSAKMDHLRVGLLIVSPDGKCLAVKRSPTKKLGGDTWGVPGGHIDLAEKVQDAALREGREELGIHESDLIRGSLTPLNSQKVKGRNYVTFVVQARHEFTPTLDDEHTAYQWVKPEEWPQPAFPTMKRNLKDLKKADASKSALQP